MNLYWFLLVVSSLALGSMPAETVAFGPSAGASLMLVAAWCVLIQIASRITRHAVEQGVDSLAAARMLERQLDVFRWLGLGVSVICLIGFRVASAVQTWPVFEASITLQSLVLLAPGIMVTAAVWFSEHRYGVAMGYTEASGFRVLRDFANAMVSTGGWILAPVMLMLMATDLLRWSKIVDEQSSAVVISIAGIVCVPFFVPLIIRRLWKTRPLNDADRGWVDSVLASVGMKHLPVCVWDTEMRSNNALVAGFFPGLRTMIVTDRLMNDMPRRDLAMVLLHEIAHVRHGHVWLRMLAMVPSWVAASLVSSLIASSSLVTVVTNVVAVAMTLVSLRLVAHATEYDADRYACRLALDLPAECDPPKTRQEAAERYSDSLRWVTRQERSPDRASWLHPSVSDRCERLQRWAGHESPANVAFSNLG